MALKRGNGTGSVYRMNHKNLRKKFRAVVVTGWTDEGKAIRKNIGTYATQKEAYEALNLYNANPAEFAKKDITFGQCWQWMLAEKERAGVDMAKAKYNAVYEKITHLMGIPIAHIKTAHLQKIIDDYSHLSFSTLQHIKAGFNGAFREGIKNDVIVKNYATLVTLPPQQKSTIHQPFTPNEIDILWQHTDNRLVRILLIYIYTGLRPIELRKIELKNVFLNEQYMVGGVKTKAGKNRVIPIADCIMPFVVELYSLAHFKQSTLLIPPKYINVRLDIPLVKLCDTFGLAQHKPHDCRHTFITMCSMINIPEHIIKSIVGHSQSDVTNDVYVHRTIKQLLQAVNSLPHHTNIQKRLSNG